MFVPFGYRDSVVYRFRSSFSLSADFRFSNSGMMFVDVCFCLFAMGKFYGLRDLVGGWISYFKVNGRFFSLE